MSALGDHLLSVAHEVLGNDTKNVLDCSTAFLVATLLRELAEPSAWVTPYVRLVELEILADEIEEKR